MPRPLTVNPFPLDYKPRPQATRPRPSGSQPRPIVTIRHPVVIASFHHPTLVSEVLRLTSGTTELPVSTSDHPVAVFRCGRRIATSMTWNNNAVNFELLFPVVLRWLHLRVPLRPSALLATCALMRHTNPCSDFRPPCQFLLGSRCPRTSCRPSEWTAHRSRTPLLVAAPHFTTVTPPVHRSAWTVCIRSCPVVQSHGQMTDTFAVQWIPTHLSDPLHRPMSTVGPAVFQWAASFIATRLWQVLAIITAECLTIRHWYIGHCSPRLHLETLQCVLR